MAETQTRCILLFISIYSAFLVYFINGPTSSMNKLNTLNIKINKIFYMDRHRQNNSDLCSFKS